MSGRADTDAAYYIREIPAGNRPALSRAITLSESSHPAKKALATEIIDGLIHLTGNSFRLGITGIPGAGKSTFIEAFGQMAVERGQRVAVLAVDPSSSITRGSILGDKTRMEKLSANEKVYIRPSPSAGALGGVTRATFEAIMLCEAAGYDFIIVETVGVGQSETAVSRLTDFFLLLLLAGAGDELQGIKRGIMELADAVVINKADSGNEKRAQAARAEFERALHLFPSHTAWVPPVMTCSSTEHSGIAEIFNMIRAFREKGKDTFIPARRTLQREALLLQSLNDAVLDRFYSGFDQQSWLNALAAKEHLNPFAEAAAILREKGC